MFGRFLKRPGGGYTQQQLRVLAETSTYKKLKSLRPLRSIVIMKLYIILACLTAMISVAQSTFVVAVTGLSTATTASLASGAALILGAKLLALKGVLIGRALRGKRETLEDIFLEASKKDQYDCAKMLVCELNAKSVLEVGLCLQSSFLKFLNLA